MNLSPAIAKSISNMGYEIPSEVQAKTIPIMQRGADFVGQAVTGSGKTAAFGIPACELVQPNSRALQVIILAPTRELAQQVAKEVARIGEAKGVRVSAIYGGEPIEKQIRRLRQGVQIVVGTPGRVMDHMARGTISLNSIRLAVLDEADEMLDIGFARDIAHILGKTPSDRQTALFSATIPGSILRLIRTYLNNPQWITLVPGARFTSVQISDDISQTYYEVAARDKNSAAHHILSAMPETSQTLIFRKMQSGVEQLERFLIRKGYPAKGVHGGMRQSERNRSMEGFRSGRTRVLIATNVAARGIDVPTITHVINYDMPGNVEEYIHRIGRTARMGRQGSALSFVAEWDKDIFRKVMAKVGEGKITRQVLPMYST